jgi:hypothetical protein
VLTNLKVGMKLVVDLMLSSYWEQDGLKRYIAELVDVPSGTRTLADLINFNSSHKWLELPRGYDDQQRYKEIDTFEARILTVIKSAGSSKQIQYLGLMKSTTKLSSETSGWEQKALLIMP